MLGPKCISAGGDPSQHVNVVSWPIVRCVMSNEMKCKIRSALRISSYVVNGYDVGGMWLLEMSVNCVTVTVTAIVTVIDTVIIILTDRNIFNSN